MLEACAGRGPPRVEASGQRLTRPRLVVPPQLRRQLLQAPPPALPRSEPSASSSERPRFALAPKRRCCTWSPAPRARAQRRASSSLRTPPWRSQAGARPQSPSACSSASTRATPSVHPAPARGMRQRALVHLEEARVARERGLPASPRSTGRPADSRLAVHVGLAAGDARGALRLAQVPLHPHGAVEAVRLAITRRQRLARLGRGPASARSSHCAHPHLDRHRRGKRSRSRSAINKGSSTTFATDSAEGWTLRRW